MAAPPPARDSRRTLIALIPFMIAVPSVIVAAILWFVVPLPKGPNSIAFGVVGAILVFDLPVCVFVTVQWLAAGQPPALSLSPLIPCREERAFRRNLRERPKLNDDDFYDRFYAASSIPRHVPIQLRTLLATHLGLDLGALHPSDNLIDANTELDWADVLDDVNQTFGIAVPYDIFERLDGTFDSLVYCVAQIADNNRPSPLNDG